jgi:hypothetical protein
VRLPFPERVSLPGVAIFASALFLVQQLEGTAVYFSAGCFAFIVIAAVAFNLAGGLTRTAGAYIFFYSLLVVIIGVTHKAMLGEPAQSNLLDPKTDILVYVAGISGLLVAVFLSRRLVLRTPLLQNILPESLVYRASVGCIAFGMVGAFALEMLGEAGFRLVTAFIQLNQLIPLGIIIGVTYEIRRSGGTRSVNIPVLMGCAYIFGFYGLLNFSKQGIFTAPLCWLLPVCALRYRLSMGQIIGALAGLFLVFYLLVPYAQYGRRFLFEGESISDKFALSTSLLSDPYELRRNYEADPGVPGYFNTAQGFWDRLQFVSVDDGLVNVTDKGKVFGLSPIPITFLNAIPHVVWANKPVVNFGNLYAHEIGYMNPDDYSTGISFSPTAEAYHMQKWVGVLAVAPALWLLFFVVFDNLLGDLRSTPWGLLAVAMLSHSAPEGGLNGTIVLVTFGVEILLFCALFSRWIAPYLAAALLAPPRDPEPVFTAPPVPIRRARTLNAGTES